MSTLADRRTTLSVRAATRERIASLAAGQTVDAFLNRLLSEHEDRVFWKQVSQVDPDEYRAACVEDDVWPGDYDFTPKARLGAPD